MRRAILSLSAALVMALLLLYALLRVPSDRVPGELDDPGVRVPIAGGNEPPTVVREVAGPPPGVAHQAAETDPEPRVSLEKLLTWTDPRASQGVDLGSGAPPDEEAEAASGSGLAERVYLKRRSEDLPTGDAKRRLETTDVGVRVPVDDSVNLRVGVRIESLEEPEADKRESTPTVGVEVGF